MDDAQAYLTEYACAFIALKILEEKTSVKSTGIGMHHREKRGEIYRGLSEAFAAVRYGDYCGRHRFHGQDKGNRGKIRRQGG